MKHYRYLIMEIGYNGHALFTGASFSGGRCCDPTTNITHFSHEQRVCGHDNDDYWHTTESLLYGFSRWLSRTSEKESYNQGNRIYAATNKYRFFKAEDTINEEVLDKANIGLSSFEILEEEFISDMFNSVEFKSVASLWDTRNSKVRTKRQPLELEIVMNNKYLTWCWSSDYLQGTDHKDNTCVTFKLPLTITPDNVKEYISNALGMRYRFGGNDDYYEKKAKGENK